MTHETLYPLLTERRLVEPLWGGTRLAEWLDLPEPRPARLGETWQVFDANLVLNGPLAGRTLAEVTRAFGAELVGARSIARYGADFPLLAKFIDAGDRLSIQVHPDDAYAHRHEASTGFYGKTEAWYILDAQPGADIIYGLAHVCTRQELAAAVQHEALEPLLHRMPVRAGDVVFVPAGTLHAINAGITLFEIQQKSDLTYRVYDYGRRDPATGQTRALHLAKALDVIDYSPARRATISPLPLDAGGIRTLLIACSSFALERWIVRDELEATTSRGSCEILTVIDGQGVLTWPDGHGNLRRGVSLVLPAVFGEYRLRAVDGPLVVLSAYVPDLDQELIPTLRAWGWGEERIAEVVAQ